MDYVREAGMWGYVIIALGLMALMESVLAAALSFGKPQPSVVALASAGTVVCVLLFGVVGTVLGQHSVERALAFVGDQPGTVMAIRHQGYLEARHAAVLGLILGLTPFLISAAVLLWRPAAPEADALAPPTQPGSPAGAPFRIVGLALLALAALLAAGCAALALRPLPGKELSPEVRQVLDHLAAAKRDAGRGTPAEPSAVAPIQPCDRLLASLDEWRHEPELDTPLTVDQLGILAELAPELQRVATKCVLSASAPPDARSVAVRLLDPGAGTQWQEQRSAAAQHD